MSDDSLFHAIHKIEKLEARIREMEPQMHELLHCLKCALDQLEPDEFYEIVEKAIEEAEEWMKNQEANTCR